MPGPIQSAVSNTITALVGTAAVNKHLLNQEETKKAELQETKMETAKELKEAEGSIRAKAMEEKAGALADPKRIQNEMTAIRQEEERARSEYFGKFEARPSDEFYEEEAKQRIEARYFELANARVAAMYQENPARQLQKDFVEGRGDRIFKTRSSYLQEYNKLNTETHLRKRATEEENYKRYADLAKTAPDLLYLSDEQIQEMNDYLNEAYEKEMEEDNK